MRLRFWRTAAPEPPRKVTALEYFEFAPMPDYSGWWVYALPSSLDRHIWYAGQTESLLRRLDDHRRAHPELFTWEGIWLKQVRDQARADIVELELIDYYQPEFNLVGRAELLRSRVRRQNKPLQRGKTYIDTRGALDPGQEAI